jgi:hypothetical protein
VHTAGEVVHLGLAVVAVVAAVAAVADREHLGSTWPKTCCWPACAMSAYDRGSATS